MVRSCMPAHSGSSSTPKVRSSQLVLAQLVHTAGPGERVEHLHRAPLVVHQLVHQLPHGHEHLVAVPGRVPHHGGHVGSPVHTPSASTSMPSASSQS